MPARIQVVLRTKDNVPANYITNTFALWTDVGADTTATETALIAFYNTLSGLFSNTLSQNGHEMRWTSLPGVKPNYPFRITSFNLTSAPASAPLPAEVAMVLSFQGSKAAGFPQARRRGRIFVGPIGQGSLHTDGRPTTASRSTIATAAATLKTALAAPGDQHWAVWSVADQTTVEIENGWVDDTFDTQRRRGLSTTARTVWT